MVCVCVMIFFNWVLKSSDFPTVIPFDNFRNEKVRHKYTSSRPLGIIILNLDHMNR